MAQADYLFVYGTLRAGANGDAHQRYLNGARFIARARIQGLLYQVSYYPALVLDNTAGWVQGEVYRLASPAQLAALDAYEECTYPALPGQEYQRCEVAVMTEHGAELSAWVYAWQHPIAGLRLIASGDFLKQ